MFKENTMITDVNLSENQLTSKCAENLCDVLASSTQLERIDVHGNRFDDKAGTYFADLMAVFEEEEDWHVAARHNVVKFRTAYNWINAKELQYERQPKDGGRTKTLNDAEMDEDIIVNQDFRELQDSARVKLPNLVVRSGKTTTERTRALSPKFRLPNRSPREVLQIMGKITGIKLADMLKPYDTVGDKVVTRQVFNKVLPKVGIDLTEEQLKVLMLELDPNNEEEIAFNPFEIEERIERFELWCSIRKDGTQNQSALFLTAGGLDLYCMLRNSAFPEASAKLPNESSVDSMTC
ncbi:unnamed protein product [Echinostoma caproni]|uniref:EF-hand domain-containing protein n=1 Tax=Echinostoma caproni TaxID=27848 RepID=A0A183AB92_9TREM|nr:unnamed protein product [Echinostoma caproni]